MSASRLPGRRGKEIGKGATGEDHVPSGIAPGCPLCRQGISQALPERMREGVRVEGQAGIQHRQHPQSSEYRQDRSSLQLNGPMESCDGVLLSRSPLLARTAKLSPERGSDVPVHSNICILACL